MYLIVNRDTNETEELSDAAAVTRYGAERLGNIIAGLDPIYEADDISEEMAENGCSDFEYDSVMDSIDPSWGAW